MWRRPVVNNDQTMETNVVPKGHNKDTSRPALNIRGCATIGAFTEHSLGRMKNQYIENVHEIYFGIYLGGPLKELVPYVREQERETVNHEETS